VTSAPNHSQNRFLTTRWSVVLQPAAADAGDALNDLTQRYWHPVYAYLRRCGHEPAVALDIAGSFLADLLRQFERSRDQPPRGRFRQYLLDRLNAFLGGDWRAAQDTTEGSDLVAPIDLEARYQRDITAAASPEAAYQHAFALEVIARALRRLRAEARQTGHLEMFEAMEPFLAREPAPGEYEAMAARLRSRPLALVVALKRLRQRFREIVGQELADTVASAEELAAELAALRAILREVMPTP
jgi:hypothetical protein